MGETTIQWTDATWNPVTGCTKVSQGCKHCYAERLAPRVFAGQAKWDNALDGFRPRRFTDVRCHPDRLEQPLRWRRPRRVFVNSMSDLFHEDVTAGFIADVWDVMERSPQHTFQILTKRPAIMQFLVASVLHRDRPPLPNVWLGVSIEDQANADERIPLLLETPAAVRFLSCEPLLGPIDLTPWLPQLVMSERQAATLAEAGAQEALRDIAAAVGRRFGLGWVIVGGESGAGARPMHPEWARSLVDQCRGAGVACFVKQLGAWQQCSAYNVRVKDRSTIALHVAGMTAMRPDNPFNPWERGHPDWIGMRRVGGHQGDPDGWPADLRVREWPQPEVPAS